MEKKFTSIDLDIGIIKIVFNKIKDKWPKARLCLKKYKEKWESLATKCDDETDNNTE
jgi:hypothetical protein